MAFWQIEFSKHAYKNYKVLQKGYQKKIDKILNLLVVKIGPRGEIYKK